MRCPPPPQGVESCFIRHPGKPAVFGAAGEIAQDLDPAAWNRLSAGEDTRGARLHDWAYLELTDIEATDYGEGRTGVWTRGLLNRRHIADGELPRS